MLGVAFVADLLRDLIAIVFAVLLTKRHSVLTYDFYLLGF